MDALEKRVERLERENRWLKRLGVVGSAVVASLLLMGQASRAIQTDKLELRGGREAATAQLEVSPANGANSVALQLYNAERLPPERHLGEYLNRQVAALSAAPDGRTGIFFSGQYGPDRAGTTQILSFPNGENKLVFLDSSGQVRAQFGITSGTGTPYLSMFDEGGQQIWSAP